MLWCYTEVVPFFVSSGLYRFSGLSRFSSVLICIVLAVCAFDIILLHRYISCNVRCGCCDMAVALFRLFRYICGVTVVPVHNVYRNRGCAVTRVVPLHLMCRYGCGVIVVRSHCNAVPLAALFQNMYRSSSCAVLAALPLPLRGYAVTAVVLLIDVPLQSLRGNVQTQRS